MSTTESGATMLALYTRLPSAEETCDFCGQPWQAPLWTLANRRNEAQLICQPCLRVIVTTALAAMNATA